MSADNSNDDKTQSFIALTSGTLVSHYRIVEKIGAGGMGEVYLAEDTQLDRKVALKFLPPHLCQDEDCRKRFKREAQAAAKLSHPNIIHVYEVSEYQGRPFFAMEHIEGRSLRDVKAEELDIDRIIGIAIQLCDGLQTAHSAGVTHRDIKPSNIIVDSSGRPKLLDFGLATVKGGEHLTKTGSTLGTVGYMSPEQIEGKETDARSDLFSLGVVLYELIANKSPFRRDDETATLKAILQDTPEPLARYKSSVPDDLQRVVGKLLEKDPTLRYQSAAGVIPDLKKLSVTPTTGVAIERKPDRWNRYVVPLAVVILLAVVAIWYFGYRDHDPMQSGDKIRLVVLPFENLGDPEDEYFADGITDEITSLISEISDIGVISRTSAYAFKDSNMTVLQIGEALGVQYVLEGTIRWDRSNDPGQVRIIPQLIDTEKDVHLWSGRFERDFVDVFEVQAEIASHIVSELGKSLTVASSEKVIAAKTNNPEAYRHYLRGIGHRNNGDFSAAQVSLSKAIECDSTFVAAHAALSLTISFKDYVSAYEELEADDRRLAKWLAERAIQMQPKSVEPLRAMGLYYQLVEGDYEKALHWYRLALEQDPEHARTHANLSGLEERLIHYEEAYKLIHLAISMDPANSDYVERLGFICFKSRKYDEAMAAFEDMIIHEPKSAFYWGLLANIEWEWSGSISRIGNIVERAYKEIPDFFSPLPNTGFPDIYDLMTGENARILERRRIHGMTPFGDNRVLYLTDRVQAAYYVGSHSEARTFADSLKVLVEEKMRLSQASSDVQSARKDWSPLQLGLANAILGDAASAREIVEEVLEDDPLGTDGWDGPWIAHSCAELLTIIGDQDRAIDLLEDMLEAPTGFSAKGLAISPFLVPLRDHPRFQVLIEKYEKEHGT